MKQHFYSKKKEQKEWIFEEFTLFPKYNKKMLHVAIKVEKSDFKAIYFYFFYS